MRLTKIYTKVGDKGATLLGTGTKVSKSDARIEAYGTVDELNATLGMLGDELRKSPNLKHFVEKIIIIQNELFDLGAELSLPDFEKLGIKLTTVNAPSIERLETEMDLFNEKLAPLENFVLPGGHFCNSLAHLCRTVCRRAERRIVSLNESEKLRAEVLCYINRLSDWLFVFGRVVSQQLDVPELQWQQRK